MIEIWIYTITSVIIVSLISLVGVCMLCIKEERLQNILFYLISFSVGALLGDVFIHILPEIMNGQNNLLISVYVLIGIMIFFILERALLWHQSHTSHEERVHSMVYLTIIGDSLHNFLDGVIIAASFLYSIPVGLATSLAVIFHEIPQEIGQFAILVHGGWSKTKALMYNFFSALPSVVGAILVLIFSESFTESPTFLLSLAAASFIYIAMSDLIPELHKELTIKRSAIQLFCMLLGIFVMALLLMI